MFGPGPKEVAVAEDVDATDAQLLAELQADARATNRALAERVGVAPSTSLDRVRGLEARGVIRGYHADVSLSHLGRPVQALVTVRIRPPTRQRIDEFSAHASSLEPTLAVFTLTGREDFVLHVAVPDTDALYSFVLDEVSSRPEVADVRTSIVYDCVRRHVQAPTD